MSNITHTAVFSHPAGKRKFSGNLWKTIGCGVVIIEAAPELERTPFVIQTAKVARVIWSVARSSSGANSRALPRRRPVYCLFYSFHWSSKTFPCAFAFWPIFLLLRVQTLFIVLLVVNQAPHTSLRSNFPLFILRHDRILAPPITNGIIEQNHQYSPHKPQWHLVHDRCLPTIP